MPLPASRSQQFLRCHAQCLEEEKRLIVRKRACLARGGRRIAGGESDS